MKRSGPPKRRTPLRPGRARSRVSTLAPRSAKRRAGGAERHRVYEACLARDRGCVIARVPDAGPCFGKLTPHHLRKPHDGGLFVEGNIVIACAHHNEMVEDRPIWAAENGLVIR